MLTKIDEILAWEKASDQERDSRFVDLGRYLCEVRAGQYWRLDNLRSFDEFLERKFPESRRKAYYLMAIHERLPRIHKADLRQVGWAKATELAKVAEARRSAVRLCNLVAQSQRAAQGRVQTRGFKSPDGEGNGGRGRFFISRLTRANCR